MHRKLFDSSNVILITLLIIFTVLEECVISKQKSMRMTLLDCKLFQKCILNYFISINVSNIVFPQEMPFFPDFTPQMLRHELQIIFL